MARSTARALGILSLLLVAGCQLLTRISNPDPDIHEVSLVPVSTDRIERTTQWTNSLRDNLLRVDGVDRVVITPYMDGPQPAAWSPDSSSLPIARSSQALLELKILTFDPHYPPSASVEIFLYVPAGIDPDADAGIHMDRLGADPGNGDAPVARHRMRFMLSFRAEDPTTATEVRLYALAQMDDDRGFDSVNRILRSSERFIDFVAFQSVKESFARLQRIRAER